MSSNPISYQKFKCQDFNIDKSKVLDRTCYIDLYCIEAFEIVEEIIFVTLRSGAFKRIYSTEKEFLKLLYDNKISINT